MKKVALSLLLALAIALAYALWPEPRGQTSVQVTDVLGPDDSAGFATVSPGRKFEFPRDHAGHEGYRSEWWYLTGNLGSFGYQFTIFRQALRSPLQELPLPRQSAWAARHAYMGHLAISDLDHGRFYHREEFAREALGLAGCQSDVWMGSWKLSWVGQDMQLRAQSGEAALDLRLHPLKPIALQGLDGYSQKGPAPDQASYYYSQSRLETSGSLRLGGQPHRVSGLSWFDREWSTRSLPKGVQGWDWFSLQFEDGQELMVYGLRRPDGSWTEQSAGTWIDKEGKTTHLSAGQIRLRPGRRWKQYPVAWTLEVEGHPAIAVQARMDDQEWKSAFRYWEGAVSATCGSEKGLGYLEMVGYQE